jgi:hypothetical protein
VIVNRKREDGRQYTSTVPRDTNNEIAYGETLENAVFLGKVKKFPEPRSSFSQE